MLNDTKKTIVFLIGGIVTELQELHELQSYTSYRGVTGVTKCNCNGER